MKHRTPAKRITSLLLGLQMVLLQPLCSLAEIPQQSPTVIAGARLSEDQLTDGELVYFGVSGLTLKEAADSYEIAIYREGNLDQEASVTVHTLDISALYGEDYRLLGDDITELESGKTLLQQAADRGREEADDESEVRDTDDKGPSSGSEDTDGDSDAIASGSEIASKGSEISDSVREAPTSGSEDTASEDFDSDDEASEDSGEHAPQGTEYSFDADGNLIGETGKTSPEEILEWTAKAAQSEADAGEAGDTEKIEHTDEAEDTEASEDIDDDDEHTDEDTNEMAEDDIEVSSHARKVKKASPSELDDDDADEAFDENDPAEDVEDEEAENRDDDADDFDDDSSTDFDDDADFDDEEANASDLDSVASASVLSVAGSDAVSSTKSRLAMLKEAATGEPTREEGSSGVSGSLTDAILSQILPEQVEAIPHSAEQTIYFAPGEDVQYLRFRICDDDRSEGTEAFSVMITDAENMEPYKVTSLSVIITDDEASEQSALSFDSDEFIVEDGKALVTLQREGAEYSMASANIRGKDAETGAEQIYGTVVFAPYETEKEVELALTKDSTLYLSDYLAAQAGTTTEANAIVIDGEEGTTLFSSVAMLSDEDEEANASNGAVANGSDDLSFDITIGGKDYKVKYKKGDVVANIYDESYQPALEVGQYFFSASTDVGGIFSYGKGQRHGSKPNGLGTLQNCYLIEKGERDFHKGEGKLEYLHTSTGCTGSVWSSNENPPAGRPTINGLYYQYLIPHWKQTSSYGGGNKVRFKLHALGAGKDLEQKDRNGKFATPELSSGAAIKVQNIADNIEAIVYAVDATKTQTPKSYMRFYGVAAMYKKYEVSVTNPEKMSFLGTTATVPMQVKMECGAQIIEAGKTDRRNIFTNVDTDDANIVFTLDKSTVNGVDGYFGTITGYNITISADDQDKKVTASYPEKYLSYLDSMIGKSVNSDAIDFSKDAVKTVKERATAHLDTIVMDKYFVNWIESLKGQTYAEKGELSSVSYYQKLNFKPTVAYTNVKVSVVPPDAGGGSTKAGFTSSDLPKAGASKIFHAGDTLDLSAKSEDANYRVTGFEISEDGGVHFNSIRDARSYTLRSGKNYVIRPLLAKNDNHVEIVFASDEARNNLRIENLIPKEKLESSYLKEKNVLNLNPEENGWAEMMKPAIGAACTVRVLVTGTPSDSNYVYRPVITDQMTGRTYQTQGYSFILRSNTADNLLKLDIEKVKKSDLREYSLSGTVVTRVKSIRETALEAKTNPAEGYAVSLANGEFVTNETRHVQLQSATTDDSGIISLAGLKAKEGDRVSLLIDNGIDDAQVADFVFGSGTLDSITQVYSVDAGLLEVQYPITAPVVTSISYDYDKSESRQKTDLRKNQVRCFDDNLKLTAVVDTKGRSIEKLVFTVRTVTGSTADYEGRATLEGSNLFTAEIPSMLTNLHNGDRITVYIVDKKKRSVMVGDTAQSIPINYPTVDTGLVSYVENEKIAPKSFDIDGAMGDVNIPLLGAAKSTAQSGILNFSRLDYPDKSGYSLNINFDMMLKDGSSKTPEQKKDAAKTFYKSAQKTSKLKKKASKAGKDAANAGASADQIRAMVEAEGRELTEEEQRKLNNYDIKKGLSERKRERKLSQAKNEQASMTKAQGYINVRAIFNLSFEFLLDPVQNEYVLATTAVTVGGAVDASKTFYTMVGYVPCFLNLSGGVEVDLTMGGVCAAGKAAFSEGDFNAYSGNVQNIFSGSDFLIELDSVVKAKVQAGAGLCGVLSARGYVSVQMKLQLVKDNVSGDPYGIILNAAGGLGFDLVLLKVDFDIAKIEQGWGNYAGEMKVEYFSNFMPNEDEDSLALNAASADDTDDHAFALNAEEDDEASTAGTFPLRAILDEAAEEDDVAAAFSLNDAYEEAYADLGEDEISFQRYDMGSSDMSSFGEETALLRSGGVNAQPVPVRMQILLEDAAERTRPEMVELPDGRAFAVFIAASDNGDSSRLYYTIYNQTDGRWSWSTPVALDADGSYDSMPALTVVGNKVVIAWMDASTKIEGTNDEETMDAYRKKFNAFRISGRVYDADKNSLGQEFQISPSELDKFYLQAPSLCTVGDKVYCTYVARDITEVTKLDELADLTKGYSTAVRATLDVSSDPVKVEKKYEYVVIRDGEKIDPLVTDYQTEGIRIEGTDYLVTAYTLDQDSDLTTGDRKLYLGLGDVTHSRNYYPIRIGSDDKCQAVPKLTKVNGHLVLSWTEDGELLELLDVSGLIEALFHTSEIGTKYSEAVGAYYVKDVKPDYSWYEKTASELGLPETVSDNSLIPGYNGSYYEAIAKGDFRTVETRIKEDEDHSSSIDDYTITGDGRDLYVFYTDFGPEIEKATVELYGRRYRMAKDTSGSTGSGTTGTSSGTTGGEGGNAGTGTNGSSAGAGETGADGSEGNGHHSDSAWGFTDAVRITDFDKVIDDFTLTMATDGSIRLLSDFYEQWINEDGKIQFSKNALAEIDFARGGSLEIDQLSIDMDSSMIAGETSTIRFDVRNAGLLEAKGFTFEAYLMENGVRTLLYSGEVNRLLDTNEETTVQIPWTVPNEDLDGKSILLSVVEKDTTTASETTAEIELKSEARLRLDMGELTFDGKEAIIPFEIENIGNAASSAGEVVAYVLDGAERRRAVGSIGLGALGSGASVGDTLRFTPEIEDWDDFGRISLELVAVQDGATVASAYGDLYSAEPVVLEIEDGAESLNLTAKAQQTLKVACAPWGALCTDLRYRSSDSHVATVDENGTVTAVGNGSCTIEVYSPTLMLKDEITVHVSGAQGGGEGDGSHSGGSSSRKTAADRASELYASGLPTWVETGGRWIQNADGSWSYQTGTSPMTNRWVCIYNPYADERRRQKRYGWFKFGPDGKMLTGWVTAADGNIYYLNPASDGTRGMMLIGWQQIDGKWYYFSKDEGSGTMGALLRNTITPDGYHVDQTGAWTGQ